MTLIYDGTFEGFLSLIYDVYHLKLKVTHIFKEKPKTLFCDDLAQITYDEEKSLKVLEALKNKFQKQHFQTVLNIFMCDSVEFEKSLLEFIVLGFKEQKQLNNINNKCVFYIQNLQKELFRLNHKMSGFIRFEELSDGTLYGKIDTKFNVVYHLGNHFCKRFNNQNFIIHDINRKIAFVKNDSYKGMQSVSSFETPSLSPSEEKFQKLWQTFFNNVAIQSRTNKKLQQNTVPLIYREFMTEFN